MPNLIFSTCGTSLLTQGASKEIRSLVNKYANYQEPQFEPDIKENLIQHIFISRNKLFETSIEEVPKLSAELNALVRFYDFQLKDHTDHHILLTTDTFLGQKTGEIIKEWLTQKQFQFSVGILTQRDLQTADLNHFHWALADLVKWIDDNINAYRESGYHIVFNLTGGFKSVQGFLQTLAMFYADEVLYVFETGKELFRIPKIPIKLVPQETIESNFELFRKLNLGIPVSIPDGLPGIMLLKLEDEYHLSDYGQIIFQQTKHILYERKIWAPPFQKVKFGSYFLKSVEKLDGKRKRMVNERIDDLIKYFITGRNPNRLDFKQLKGKPKPPSTHEFDAWADQDAKRIYGHWEQDVFILDILDNALH